MRKCVEGVWVKKNTASELEAVFVIGVVGRCVLPEEDVEHHGGDADEDTCEQSALGGGHIQRGIGLEFHHFFLR